MEDTSKYLIHADVTADGVVERSDVVGAIFGQTEGLLGDELDLRDLRQSQKVGRIDVDITSTNGRSHGHLTIATSLDKVETATLAASLETISRVGPCQADLEVTGIEDVRAAKRKEVVDRAKELLRTGFDDSVMSSEEILTEVRQHVRVEDMTEYEGLPAGPHVTDSDAIIVVEGRADVRTLLKYGIKNAIAVEGTNVPEPVAELTHDRTVTAFLDGDRGGELIFEELSQVGDIDYVAFAPDGDSVEDLDHHQLFTELQKKVPYEIVSEANEPRADITVAATDGSELPAPSTTSGSGGESTLEADSTPQPSEPVPDPSDDDPNGNASEAAATPESPVSVEAGAEPEGTDTPNTPNSAGSSTETDEATSGSETAMDTEEPRSIYGHANAIVHGETDAVRFLTADGSIVEQAHASEAYGTLEDLEESPSGIVIDSILDQRLLDLAATRGVDRIVARSLGQFTKRPTSVRVHSIDDIADTPPKSP